MPAIKSMMVYQCTIQGVDNASGKQLRNILYYRSGFNPTTPYAYGEDITDSSLSGFGASVESIVTASFPLVTNDTGNWSSIDIRNIVGSGYPTRSLNLVTVASSAGLTLMITSEPHGFVTGDVVHVYGCDSVVSLNGLWTIVVLSDSSFSINYDSSAYTWGGDGAVQAAEGKKVFAYGDHLELPVDIDGGVASEALPLFATGSVRRLNAGVGRHFRSRISISPLPESHWIDGTLAGAGVTAWGNFATQAVKTGWNNGIEDNGTNYQWAMYPLAISPALALSQSSPFTQSESWAKQVTSFTVRLNNGSLIRRKPKLAGSISPPA